MMGKNHITSGLIAGCYVSALVGHAPLSVRVLVIPVMGGAAALCDIDTKQSRAARSLGPITQLIAVGVAALAVAVYDATRTEKDSPGSNNGHRRLTHTLPGCALFGVIAAVAVLSHPIAGVVALSLLIGLTANGFKAIGVGFTLGGAFVSWVALTQAPTWWWIWPATVTAGAVVHVAGDAVTNSGAPLWWPIVRDGKRWAKVRPPITFDTGGAVEQGPVTVLLAVSLVVALGFAAGVNQMLIAAWMGA